MLDHPSSYFLFEGAQEGGAGEVSAVHDDLKSRTCELKGNRNNYEISAMIITPSKCSLRIHALAVSAQSTRTSVFMFVTSLYEAPTWNFPRLKPLPRPAFSTTSRLA